MRKKRSTTEDKEWLTASCKICMMERTCLGALQQSKTNLDAALFLISFLVHLCYFC